MKIDLVFFEWKSDRSTKISGSERMNLEKGDFYFGSTFKGEIALSLHQKLEIRDAIARGYRPSVTIYLSRKGEEW